MTDLMKRYEAETGEMNDFEKNMYKEIRMLREKVSTLRLENAKLKAQLTWRPISEKPNKADMYLAEVKPYTERETTIITTAYFVGDCFPHLDVVKWLTIPPQEAKV